MKALDPFSAEDELPGEETNSSDKMPSPAAARPSLCTCLFRTWMYSWGGRDPAFLGAVDEGPHREDCLRSSGLSSLRGGEPVCECRAPRTRFTPWCLGSSWWVLQQWFCLFLWSGGPLSFVDDNAGTYLILPKWSGGPQCPAESVHCLCCDGRVIAFSCNENWIARSSACSNSAWEKQGFKGKQKQTLQPSWLLGNPRHWASAALCCPSLVMTAHV